MAHATLFGALKCGYTSPERTRIGAVNRADSGVSLDDVVHRVRGVNLVQSGVTGFCPLEWG